MMKVLVKSREEINWRANWTEETKQFQLKLIVHFGLWSTSTCNITVLVVSLQWLVSKLAWELKQAIAIFLVDSLHYVPTFKHIRLL